MYFHAPLSIGICHSYILYTGDIEKVERSYKDFDKLTVLERFDNIYDPHILYVKLLETHVHQRAKRARCNVKVKISLRDNETKDKHKECIRFGKSAMA